MADLVLIGVLFLGSLLVLYAMGVPVAFAMGASCILIWLAPFGPGIQFNVMATNLLHGVNSFPLIALPFYILLGRIMNEIGMTDRIFDFAGSIVGHFRGGIAHINVVASMIFSGMSGLATADAAGLGRIEYAAMRNHGYDKGTALGVTSSSALIGPIIPPSVTMIIYAVLTGESTGDLFLAGIFPGILMGLSLMAFIVFLSYRRDFGAGNEFELSEVFRSFKESYHALFTPILIIGGLLSGWFTATEAGVVAVVYAILVGSIFYGELDLSTLFDQIKHSMIESSALAFIIAMASLYGFVAIQLGLPVLLVDAFTGITQDPTMLIIILAILFLFVGTFMDTVAAITVLIPVLLPVLEAANIDLTYFGIIMLVTLLLGAITPPFGIILFVMEKVTDASLEEVFRGVLPFYVPIIVILILCIFVPDIIMFIPTAFGG